MILPSLLDIVNDDDEMINEEEYPIIFEESHYFDTHSSMETLKNKDNKFSILTLNCQSINAKFSDLQIYIQSFYDFGCSFSAICLQETWLAEDADVSLLQLPGYNLISRGMSCSAHGGVAIYLKDNFNYKMYNTNVNSDIFDSLFIEIDLDECGTNRTLVLGNIYRPPRELVENYNTFIDQIDSILHNFQSKSNVAICGDFNIDLLKIQDRPIFNTYFETLLLNSFIPKITHPTRITNTSATLIDNVLIKITNNFSNTTCGIINANISDHLPCFAILDFLNVTNKQDNYIKICKYSEAKILDLKREISHECNLYNFHSDEIDPNVSYNNLETIIANAISNNLPEKLVKFKKYKHKKTPWITQGIIASIRFRDKLYKRMVSTPSDTQLFLTLKTNLKTYNKILRQNIRAAKKEYFQNCFNKYKNDARMTWSTIKDILNKTKSKQNFPNYFMINGTQISDAQDIANKFNDYFVNIGPNLASNVSINSTYSFKDYLLSPVQTAFQFSLIDEQTILKTIDNLKNKCSCGSDRISNKILKIIKQEIAAPLSHIINQSFLHGSFPENLKIAKVIPLYKNDDNTLLKNYRPISILPSLSKIFERIIHSQLIAHFNSLNLFYKSQYGFRKSHSTELAALELINRNLEIMDKHKIALNIYIDLSKAFDTLDHSLLLYKLKYYGIHGKALQLFNSYLSNRKQYVDTGTHKSELLNITTGVPQGSILGPVLFIIYMNDFHVATSNFHPIIYADDSTLATSLDYSGNIDSQVQTINNEINNISIWLKLNKLSLNVSKTKAMIFHTKNRAIANPKIKIENRDIEFVNTFNFLGITLDKNLSWTIHAEKIGRKISKTIGIMTKMKHFLPKEILLTLYNALIVPHINYGILCWKPKINNIFKLQKKAIRIIDNKRYNSHTNPIFKSLNLLKAPDICALHELKFCYKLENRLLPSYYLNNLFIRNFELHSYNVRNNDNLHLPRVRHEFAKSSIQYIIPITFNNAPSLIKEKIYTHSYKGFSQYVKKWYISQYNVQCNIPDCYVCRDNFIT